MSQAKARASFQPFSAADYRVGIVVAQFNSELTGRLLSNARRVLTRYRVPAKNVRVVRAAGCVEIPLLLQALARENKYDCLVALGAIIRGETAHFEYVSKIVSEGVLRVMLDHNIPVGFGVLTLNDPAQAKTRLDSGAGAMEAALQSARSLRALH